MGGNKSECNRLWVRIKIWKQDEKNNFEKKRKKKSSYKKISSVGQILCDTLTSKLTDSKT